MRKLLTMIIWMTIGTGICAAQTTAFTYQGKLNDGGIATNGNYDFEFRLFDTPTTGSGTQVGATVTHSNIAVANGIFSVELDFGSTAFTTTLQRYLEIRIRPAGNADPLTTLSPRQKITSAPTTIRSVQAADLNCVGCVSDNEITTINGSKVFGSVGTANSAGSASNLFCTSCVSDSEIEDVSGSKVIGAVNVANTISSGGGDGIVNIFGFGTMTAASITPSPTSWSFVGNPAFVSPFVTPRRVTGSASAVLSTAMGSTSIDIGFCYRTSGSMTVTPFTLSLLNLPVSTRSIFSYSGTETLPANTDSIGLCVRNFGANSIFGVNVSGWVMVPK